MDDQSAEDIANTAMKPKRGRPRKVPLVTPAHRLEWLKSKLGDKFAEVIEGKTSKEILALCRNAALTFGDFDNAAKYSTTLIQYEEAKPATVVNTNVGSMDDMSDEELRRKAGIVGEVVALQVVRDR